MTPAIIAALVGVAIGWSAAFVLWRIDPMRRRIAADGPDDMFDDADPSIECTWCGGVGSSECDDPIQCTHPDCDGEWCYCSACDGRGYDQVVW